MDTAPQVIGILIRRGVDFAAAEEADAQGLDERLPDDERLLRAHPSLPMASAIALTLRAVGGLTTRQIAGAWPPCCGWSLCGSTRLRLNEGYNGYNEGYNEGYTGEGDDGELIPFTEQDRTRWDGHAVAVLPADAASTAETDWIQLVEGDDESPALRDDPVARLGRAVS